MDMALLGALMEKLLMMLLFMVAGFILSRARIITDEGSKSMAGVLIYLILPCVIINSFSIERTADKVGALALSMLLAAVGLAVCLLVSRLLFRRDPIARFASSFSNPGFFGIPIILSVLGQDAVFYVAMYIAFLNVLQWYYGAALFQEGKSRFDVRQLFSSPFMVALLIGLVLFFGNLRLPAPIRTAVEMTANLNTPIAMMITGVYMAHVNWKSMLTTPAVYKVCAARLLLIPAILLPLLLLVPDRFAAARMTVFIAAACPVGSNVAVYAQMYHKDYAYAVQMVVISALLAMLSLPVMLSIAQLVW